MIEPDSPLKRPLRLQTLVRGLIALAALVVVVAAFAEGHPVLGIVALLFFTMAATGAYWASRARRAARGESAPRSPR